MSLAKAISKMTGLNQGSGKPAFEDYSFNKGSEKLAYGLIFQKPIKEPYR
jgi:hypothetical protein